MRHFVDNSKSQDAADGFVAKSDEGDGVNFVRRIIRKTPKRLTDSRGTVLLLAYFVMVVVSIFSLALFSRSQIFLRSSEHTQNRIVAFNMAEAGFATALQALETNIAYAGTGEFTSLATPSVQGGFEVEVQAVGDSGNVRFIRATGYSPSNDPGTRAAERRAVHGYVQVQSPGLFNAAVFADNAIAMSGSVQVDSYDSRVGVYSASNQGSDGDLMTNSTDPSAISIAGTSQVQGNVTVGPTSVTDLTQVVSMGANADVSGTVASLSTAIETPVETTNVISSGAMDLTGDQIQSLSSGTYHFSSLTVSENSKLFIPEGQVVKIYVSGSVNISGGGILNEAALPQNLLIYATTSQDVRITGDTPFYGGVYAPLSNVSVSGSGSFYGAVVANNYSQTGSGNLHFDKAMTQIAGSGTPEAKVLSWWEDHTVMGG